MYVVEITSGQITRQIHGDKEKLSSGKIIKGINTIDSFTFSMTPSNVGFNLVNEFSTLVTAYNLNKARYDFIGRVLYAETTMDESGLITKTVTCENVLGYLCDSFQTYVEEKNWTVSGLLKHLLDCHNSLVESHKQFKLGIVTAEDKNDNLFQAVQRENTWDAIKSKLIDKIGGELQVRFEEDGMYLDYLDQIGEQKQTEIALSANMKAITKEQDPSAFVTRLIPLGNKLKKTVDVETEDGWKTEEVESEERLNITSVNNGLNYIDDEQAVEVYGIHVGVVEWDDVTEPANLKKKGEEWIKENNKVQVKYSITALDLSLIGLAVDDFDVGNIHRIKNGLIHVDDTARIIKKSIDVCEEVKSTIEVGDSFKTLSDIQREQAALLKGVEYLTSDLVIKNYILNQRLESTKKELLETFSSKIEQLADSITLEVTGSLGSEASIIISAGDNKHTGELSLSQIRKAFANDPTAISISAGTLTFNSNTIIINSSYFTLDSKGYVTATGGTIGGWTMESSKLYAGDGTNLKTVAIQAPNSSNLYVFAAGGTSHDSYADCPFRVTKAGKLYATDSVITGSITTIDSPYKTVLDNGSLQLFYEDALCGTVNTKYFSNASTPGISLRVEDGGKYIMFSHADDSYGSGYALDYILDYGWSYEEGSTKLTNARHTFVTSAVFIDRTFLMQPYFLGGYLVEGPFLKGCDLYGNVTEEIMGVSEEVLYLGSNHRNTVIRGSTVYLKNTSTTVTSDRNAKNSIEVLPDAYETFIDALEPVRFKYNEGTSGRYHVGYIAQDVEAALTAAGLSTMDFAGYVDISKSGELGLMYDEFISLLHLKIKKLEQRIAAFENKYGTESVTT